MTLVTFDEQVSINDVLDFGIHSRLNLMAAGVEIPSNTWRTVLAHESGSVLLEVKKGPFNPSAAKDLAPWAPAEGSASANKYLDILFKLAKKLFFRVVL